MYTAAPTYSAAPPPGGAPLSQGGDTDDKLRRRIRELEVENGRLNEALRVANAKSSPGAAGVPKDEEILQALRRQLAETEDRLGQERAHAGQLKSQLEQAQAWGAAGASGEEDVVDLRTRIRSLEADLAKERGGTMRPRGNSGAPPGPDRVGVATQTEGEGLDSTVRTVTLHGDDVGQANSEQGGIEELRRDLHHELQQKIQEERDAIASKQAELHQKAERAEREAVDLRRQLEEMSGERTRERGAAAERDGIRSELERAREEIGGMAKEMSRLKSELEKEKVMALQQESAAAALRMSFATAARNNRDNRGSNVSRVSEVWSPEDAGPRSQARSGSPTDPMRQRRSRASIFKANVAPQSQDNSMWEPEHLRRVVEELFPLHDADNSGHLDWKSGEVVKFLVEFFEKHHLAPPTLPKVLYARLYHEVKAEDGRPDIDGLEIDGMCTFAKRVHDLVYTSFKGEMKTQMSEKKTRRKSLADRVQKSVKNNAVPLNVLASGKFLSSKVLEQAEKLQSAEPRHRREAVEALTELGDQATPITKRIAEALKDTDPKVSAAAATSLRRLGPNAAPAAGKLAQLVQHHRPEVRRAATKALGDIGSAAVEIGASARLGETLKDSRPEVRMDAALLLGKLGPGAASQVSALAELFHDPDARVRALAATAVGELGPDGAAPALTALEQLQRDKVQEVAEAAQAAFAKLREHGHLGRPMPRKSLE